MKIIDCEQGSPEWLAIRAGKITSTDIDSVLVQKTDSSMRANLRARLVAEILSGKPCGNGYQSKAMHEGKDNEPFARAAYEVVREVMVEQVGFVQHPTIDRAGCSPDGLVGDDGILEIKCPNHATHVDYLLRDRIPPEYAKQCIWHLACTGREWVDFVSYNADFPAHLQLFIKRMIADEAVIADFNAKVSQVLKEVNGLLIQLGQVEKVLA